MKCHIRTCTKRGRFTCSGCGNKFCSDHSRGQKYFLHLKDVLGETAIDRAVEKKGRLCIECMSGLALPEGWYDSYIGQICAFEGCSENFSGPFSKKRACAVCGLWFCPKHVRPLKDVHLQWISKFALFGGTGFVCEGCQSDIEINPEMPVLQEKGRLKKRINQLLQAILKQGVDGKGALNGSEALAAEYMSDDSYASIEERVDSMIKWEATKNFGTGFLSGIGGAATLPISVPAGIYASWVVQARLAGAIASMYGHDISSDRVRTFVLLTIIGDSGKEVLKTAGMSAAGRLTEQAVMKVPSRVILDINEKIGFHLLSKSGTSGLINLSRAAPLAGGLTGGIIDALSCIVSGKSARKFFGSDDYHEEDISQKYNIKIGEDKVSAIVAANADFIKYVKVPADDVFMIKIKGIPLRIQYRFKGFEKGVLHFCGEGNIFQRGILKVVLRSLQKRIPADFSDIIYVGKDTVSLDVNRALDKFSTSVRGIRIKDLNVKKGFIIALLE